jgi:DNA helicase-2/ATP-dependent DNA helicase PcrA
VLSDEQLRVVKHDEGPLLVVAGPGSGKTRVLTERFVRLVQEGKAAPDQILTLAYNSDAAWEMLRRVRSRLGYRDYPIFTFHAFARRTLAEYGWLTGLPTSFRMMTERVEQWQQIMKVIELLRPSFFYPPHPRRDLAPLQSLISRAKQEGVSHSKLRQWAEARRTGTESAADREADLLLEVSQIYETLDATYASEGWFDFDDLIYKLADALAVSKPLRGALAARFQFFMVDEYQDTNFTQALMLERLVPEPYNIVAVADDDQAIYKFRGASLANIRRFKRTYQEAPELALGINYRSTQAIVAATREFIELSTARESKPLRTEGVPGNRITVVTAPDLISEAKWVAMACRRVLNEGAAPHDVAILARTNAQLAPFAQALADEGITYELSGGGDYFVRPEVKDLVALVRVAADPRDDLAWIRLLRVPRYRITNAARLRLVHDLHQTSSHIIDLETGWLSANDTEFFTQLKTDIIGLANLAQDVSAREVVHTAFERSHYAGVLEREHPLDVLEGAANVRKFADLVGRFDTDHPGAGIREFSEYLWLAAQADTEQADSPREVGADSIRLSTAHSSKGLEFAFVFIVNVAERRFPLESRPRYLELPADLVEEELEDTPAIDEERRLFYVAMTRARLALTITYARKYNSWAKEPVSASQFLVELREAIPEAIEEVAAEQALVPPHGDSSARGPVLDSLRPFSVSQLLEFSDCPRRYSYQHEFHLPQRETRDLAFGNLTHHALEQAARLRLTGIEAAESEVRRFVDDSWRAATFDKLLWPELREEAVATVTGYLATPAWREAEIVDVEREFSYEDSPFVFAGRIDRIDRREGRLVIVDYKSGRPRTIEQVQKDFRLGRQIGVYRLGARRLVGNEPIDLEVHFISGGEAISVERGEDQLERDRRWAWAIANGITTARTKREFTVNPSDFNCPTCPFRLVCDEGQEFMRRNL